MSGVLREARFLLRDRGALLWIMLALLLSVAATGFGIAEVREQRATIAALLVEDTVDRENALAGQSDWRRRGLMPPFTSPYAPAIGVFLAALGQRDTAPWLHRVRMLALEGQIHEADTKNADFGLIGRFDFASLAAAVAPLLLILLLHDLRGQERVAGRHDLLVATAGKPSRLLAAARGPAFCRPGDRAAAAVLGRCGDRGRRDGKVLAASALVLGALALWWLIIELVGRAQASPPVLLTALVGIRTCAGLAGPGGRAGRRSKRPRLCPMVRRS